MAQVELVELSKTFRHRRAPVDALKLVNLKVPSGDLVVLLGASGSGKSTLLRCVAGLERPNSGRISIGQDTVWDRSKGIDVRPNKRNLGMVFQSYALWPHMTARENVDYPLRVRHLRNNFKSTRVQEVLSMVGCGHLADRLPSALSGGEQQRVALARALVTSPEVLLFDEPLSNVDALLRRELREQIKRLHQEVGFTAIYVTHDQSEALYLGRQVAVMRGGIIEQIGTPVDVYRFPATEPLARFLGAKNALTLRDGWNRGLAGQLAKSLNGKVGDISDARVLVRSEDVQLRAGPLEAEDRNRLVLGEVTVRSISFAGEWMEYELELGSLVLYASSRDRTVTISPGEKAWATTEIDTVLLYRGEHLVYPIQPVAGSSAAAQNGGA